MTTALLTSCYKKEDFDLNMLANEQSVAYDLALPLFETKVTIDDLLSHLNSSQIITDDKGLVHFIYPSLSFVNFWEKLNITVPPSLRVRITDIPYMKLDTVVTYTHSDTIEFFAQNHRGSNMPIDSVAFAEFNLSFDLTENTIGAPVTIRFALPSITDVSTGMPAAFDMTSETGKRSISFTNVTWNAAHDRNEQNIYRVPVVVTLTVDLSAATDTIPRTGSLGSSISFDNYDYNRVYGNIGNEIYTLKTSVDAGSLIDFPVDNVTLYQLLLTSRVSLNGISIPLKLKNNRIAGVKANGDTLELSPIFPPNYDVPSPLPTDNPLQKTTENKSEIIAAVPLSEMKEFFGEFTIETNPLDLSNQQNILEKDANLRVDFDMDVPMDFSMDNHPESDTIPFDMFTSELIDLIHGFNLKMILKNAFPIDVDVSVDFLDSAYNPVLSIYEGKIAGGEMNPDFHVVKPKIVNVEIDLLAHEVLALKKIRYISVVSLLDTKDKGEVKIFAGSEEEGYLSIKTGARIKFKAGALIKDYLK
jgi:hypothetical protein